jgi:ABC-type polysaccharide/polyol phosphate transport system ATPase subunit
MAILEVNDVHKSFLLPTARRRTVREHALDLFRRRSVEELKVLESIRFAVERGESFGLMGRNGCGKSTLLKIVSGVYPPDAGSVVVRAGLTPILELGVGWNPELNAIDNIALLGSVMGLSRAQLRSSMGDILAFAELERFAHLKLQHYSSGMAARLAYAVAFTAVREVLVLDEIFAVGDAAFQARCKQRYRELHASGHTLILVSHDPMTIATFCTRAVLLERGHILMEGSSAEVAEAYESLMNPVAAPSEVPILVEAS